MVTAAGELRPECKPKSIRSYVIRSGRLTDSQKRAFDHAWSRYGLSLFSGPLDQQQVFARRAPLVVEVGFGTGESLLAMAVAEAELDFIGIEVYAAGVGQLMNSASKKGIPNLRIYMADAIDVLQDCLIDSSVTRFQLFFPDPWHKKKHHKRRIVQPHFVELMRRKLTVGGSCHFATDCEHYADQMMSVMTQADGFTNHAGEHMFSKRPFSKRLGYRLPTKFEQRGERLGHRIWDLLFKRTA